MKGPHFICIGAQKAGTDWIYDQFAAHRDFWMPPIKEVTFFDSGFRQSKRRLAERKLGWMTVRHGRGEANYLHEIDFLLKMLHGRARPGSLDFGAYFALFEGRPGLSGDCTPEYALLGRKVVAAIYDQMPETRFLYTIRDPIDRLWSQALMHQRLDWGGGLRPVDSFEGFQAFAMRDGVQQRSLQSQTIRRWREIDAGAGRFAVFQFDELRDDAASFRRKVAEHVGADPDGFDITPGHNRKAAQPGKKPMPDAWRTWLAPHFAKEYRRLERLIGGHTTDWRMRNDAVLGSGPMDPS
jgi:hypothetical protein